MRWLIVALVASGCTSDDIASPPPDFAVDAGVEDQALLDLVMPTGPQLLSQTGLYADFASRTLAPGIIEYQPRYELWSDGAVKNRYLLLPPNTKIDDGDMDDWVFPVGTKIWKQFTVPVDGGGGIVVETRLLQKEIDSKYGWWEVAYVWRADGSDADATPGGVEDPQGTIHRVPSQMDCNACHGNRRDVPIGVSAIQLSTPDGGMGLLTQLSDLGKLTRVPGTEYSPPGQGVVQDALGYLHGNCGHCHNPEWGLAGRVHLWMRLTIADATPEETATYKSAIGGITGHDLPGVGNIAVQPGDPAHSQLYARMGHRDDGWEMPPVCTKLVDVNGRQTIHDWILGLP
jgi:hypothetical protein